MGIKRGICACLLAVFGAGAPAGGGEAWDSSNPARFGRIDFARSVWHEGSGDAGEAAYDVECFGGAEGRVEIVRKGGRDGGPALRTVKANDAGYMVVTFRRRIQVKEGDRLQLNVYYRTLRTRPRYSLALLRLQVPGQKDYRRFSFHSGINGGDRLQEVLGTPRSTWERKLTQRQAGKGHRFFIPTLVLAGAGSDVVWDDFHVEDAAVSAENWERSLDRRKPRDRAGSMLSLEEVEERLRREPDHTGKLVSIGGRSRLLIDGRPVVPIVNGPYSKLDAERTYSNAGEFARIGVHLTRVSVRLGQGRPAETYPGCWTGRGRFDEDTAVAVVRNALRLDPDARIILSIMLHPYADFCRDHPEETWLDSKGRKVYGSGIHLDESCTGEPKNRNRYPWPSYQSAVLRKAYEQQIGRLISGLRRAGLAKMVVGLHIGGGHDNQMTLTHLDYSRPAIGRFREYLKEKYRTEKALRTAWNDPRASFADAAAPEFNHSRDCFRPREDQARIDFYEYSRTAPWRMASEIADHARKLLGKDVFTLRWCMGPYSGAPGASLDIADFLENQHFDVLVAQASYNSRPPGSACVPRLPLDSFHIHGKLYINEFDIRTWNAAPSWEKELMSITWGLILDPPMWRSAHRKLAGSMFANGMGFWYLDMAPGWFDHPEIMKDIQATAETGRRLLDEPAPAWRKDSAVVVDDRGMLLYNLPACHWRFDMTSMLNDQVALLGQSGVPTAFLGLDDLLADHALAARFKVLVFAGMLDIDAPRRRLLDSLKNSGRTLIFLSGTGRVNGSEEGTGFRLAATRRERNHDVVPEPGVAENMESIWMTGLRMSLNSKPEWYEYITIVHAEEQPGDRVMARFAFNGRPAVVERRHAGWKAVYIGEAGGLTPGYFNRLVREAGAYRTADADFQCETDGRFMSIHCLKSGPATFRFPFLADVVNLCSGRKYRGVAELSTHADAGSTYWFKMTPAPASR